MEVFAPGCGAAYRVDLNCLPDHRDHMLAFDNKKHTDATSWKFSGIMYMPC